MIIYTNPANKHLIQDKLKDFDQDGVFRTKCIEVVFSPYMPIDKVKSYKTVKERSVEYDVCDWTIYCGFVVAHEYEPLFIAAQQQRSVFNSIDGMVFR